MARSVLLSVARSVAGLLILLAVGIPSPCSAEGPWRGQVLDAETGQPLEGVAVVAVWYLRHAGLEGWVGGGYHDSEEMVTGPDGRFLIQARSVPIQAPGRRIGGPEWFLFKPGYGRWRVAGIDPAWPWWQRADRIEEAWRDLTGKGIRLEMPLLRTVRERQTSLPDPPHEVPWKRTPRFIEMINRERAAFGWKPAYQGEEPAR